MSAARRACAILTALSLVSVTSCSSRGGGELDESIRITGSDTMVNLTLAWVEAFNKERDPPAQVIIRGGGSGVGIANLCSGRIEVAIASRPMKPKEIELAKKNTGRMPKEFIVGRDALAIYVHRDNRLEQISLEQLGDIYGAKGTTDRWKQLGVDNSACRDDEIIRVSRQNSSGTFAYFKEAILGKSGEYKQGYTAQNGSSDVVALISRTPCAIGYSGMGYRTDSVKVLKLSRKTGEAGIEPTVATALDGSYPISRPLYFYTLGEPVGAAAEFIHWVQSDEGQRVVEKEGYVPVYAEKTTSSFKTKKIGISGATSLKEMFLSRGLVARIFFGWPGLACFGEWGVTDVWIGRGLVASFEQPCFQRVAPRHIPS